jgi:hypothetical protein
MINWTFILNPDTDNLLIDEPVGWADVDLEIVRDTKFHGVSIAYGTDDLQLRGEAAEVVEEAYKAKRLDADVKIRIRMECETEVIEEDFQLDFGTYEKVCGEECYVRIGVEQASCFSKFNANFDKQVDVESAKTFDTVTNTDPLPNLKKTIVLPPKTILKSAEGKVLVDGDITEFDFMEAFAIDWSVRPVFGDTKYESLATSQLSQPAAFFAYGATESDIVSPVLLYEDNPVCFTGDFDVYLRMKGTVQVREQTGPGKIFWLKASILKVHGSYAGAGPITVLQEVTLASMRSIDGTYASFPFDIAYTNPTMPLVEGDCLYMVVRAQQGAVGDFHGQVKATFAPETEVKIIGKSLCPATDGEIFLTFETLSRVADIITDGCLQVDSNYYGRTDSNVVYPEDGCGSLRALTSGLHIRNAPERRFFTSMKTLLEGLRPIDAVGFALEKEAGIERIVVEPVGYFYNQTEVLRLDGVKKVSKKSLPGSAVGSILVGYTKWEPGAINGLDEFNSTREYRTLSKNAKTKEDIQSGFVAAGYIIELIRIQNYALTGAADNKYDNETVIIQLKRDPDGEVVVEQGIDTGAANVVDPPTVYNYRLSPLRNLLRWWGWLSGLCFPDVSAAEAKMIFGSGTGNYLAEGKMNGDCSPEIAVLKENESVEITDLATTELRRPILRAESITFDYPMSMSDFGALRANPYGYISYESDGTWEKAYIFKVTYKKQQGIATFDLRTKYE